MMSCTLAIDYDTHIVVIKYAPGFVTAGCADWFHVPFDVLSSLET